MAGPSWPRPGPAAACALRLHDRLLGLAEVAAASLGRHGAHPAPRSTYHASLCLGALPPCRNGGPTTEVMGHFPALPCPARRHGELSSGSVTPSEERCAKSPVRSLRGLTCVAASDQGWLS